MKLLYLSFIITSVIHSPGREIAIRIGKTNITYRDIQYRQKIDSIYNGGSTNEASIQAALHLINDALEKEVLRGRYGLVPSDSTLERIANDMKLHSKDSERLSLVIKIFDSNRAAFLNQYVAPVTINPRLHTTFSADTIIHAAPRSGMLRIRESVIAQP